MVNYNFKKSTTTYALPWKGTLFLIFVLLLKLIVRIGCNLSAVRLFTKVCYDIKNEKTNRFVDRVLIDSMGYQKAISGFRYLTETSPGLSKLAKIKMMLSFLQLTSNIPVLYWLLHCILKINRRLPRYLQVEPSDLPDANSVDKQYVYLVAKSDDAHFQFHKEARILLSYRDGMVFIQTDKPIYTPRQRGTKAALLEIENVI